MAGEGGFGQSEEGKQMGVHQVTAKPEHLTDFYALGPGYLSAYGLLSPYQQAVVEAHVESVGQELINYLCANFDVQRAGYTSIGLKRSALWRLVSGQVDEAIMIGERSSLALVRQLGLVLINDVTWHPVH